VDKEVVMLDVGGLSLGLLNVMPLFKVVNTIGSSYFPERTINILVLNAPRVFRQLWASVRPAARREAICVASHACHALQLQKLVDPRTQKKVHILSGGEQQLSGAPHARATHGAVVTDARVAPACAVLRTFLEDADIPTTLGGSRKAPFLSGSDPQATAFVYACGARGVASVL
jgi:hypothetical protein